MHQYLLSQGRKIDNPIKKLISLDSRRDKLSRAQKIKAIKLTTQNENAALSFPYLRHSYFKKLLLAQFIGNTLEKSSFLDQDFLYPIMKSVFKSAKYINETIKKERAISDQSSGSNLSGSGNELDESPNIRDNKIELGQKVLPISSK